MHNKFEEELMYIDKLDSFNHHQKNYALMNMIYNSYFIKNNKN